MPTCIRCGRTFHACSSCSLDYAWEWEYCSAKCYKSSDEYAHGIKAINALLAKLGPTELDIIIECANDELYRGIFYEVVLKEIPFV